MFIKILTPNHNGKIELTVRDLEALIQEAVDKAVSEKCAGCNRGYWYSYDSNPIHTYPNLTISGTTESNVKDNIAYLNDSTFGADLATSYKKTDPSCLTYTTGTIFTNATKGE